MKKILFIFIILITSSVSALDIYSNNAILYNLNEDSVIYEKNSDEKVYIASLTKIVTAITVLENISDLDSEVNITYDMLTGLDGYAIIGLRVGNKITYRELLYLLLLNSAADSAQALAIDVGGSIDGFSTLMNEEVSKIGATSSKFDNPVGMDSDNNYSTVSDMAKILKYCLQNKTFKEIFETDEYYIKSINVTAKKTIRQTGLNNNINTDIISGAKTGFTYDAGLCLASTASYNDINYLLVTTNAPIDYPYHLLDALNIYEFYMSNYGYKKIVLKDQLITEIPIKNGVSDNYKIKAPYDILKYLENDFDLEKIEYKYSGIDLITKNIDSDAYLGHVDIIYDGSVLDSFNVYLDGKPEFKKDKTNTYIKIILISISSLFVFILLIKKLAISLKKSF